MKQAVRNRISSSRGDTVYYVISGIIMSVLLVIALYPMIFVLSASFSSGDAVSSGRVVLWPVELNLEGYKTVFRNSDILRAYGNTLLYTVVGTTINVAMALITAYPLSSRDLKGKGFDPRKLLLPGYEAIMAKVEEKMNLFGSVDKA